MLRTAAFASCTFDASDVEAYVERRKPLQIPIIGLTKKQSVRRCPDRAPCLHPSSRSVVNCVKGRFRGDRLSLFALAATHQPRLQSMCVLVANRGYRPFVRKGRPAAWSAPYQFAPGAANVGRCKFASRAVSPLRAYSVEKLMVFRVVDHRVNGSCLDFIERHWPELGSELVWLTF